MNYEWVIASKVGNAHPNTGLRTQQFRILSGLTGFSGFQDLVIPVQVTGN